MRPYLLHIYVLAVLMIPGAALLIVEFFSTQTGGLLFSKYDATQLYWLGLLGYSVISTVVAVTVYSVFRVKNKRFTKKAVILSHVVPVGLVFVFIELGLHDRTQDAWRKWTNRPKSTLTHTTKKIQKPQIPQAPLSKPLNLKAPTMPVESPKQTIPEGNFDKTKK